MQVELARDASLKTNVDRQTLTQGCIYAASDLAASEATRRCVCMEQNNYL